MTPSQLQAMHLRTVSLDKKFEGPVFEHAFDLIIKVFWYGIVEDGRGVFQNRADADRIKFQNVLN